MLKRLVILIFAVIGCVGCDQQTKIWAKELLQPGQSLSYFNDSFQFILVENHGAFLGLGNQLPEHLKTIIFVGLISVGLVAGLIWASRAKNMTFLGYLATVFFISGGIGNLIDRAFNHGGVVDFMYMGFGSVHTGIFNVADIFIMIAAAIMFYLSFRPRKTADA
jgi:signal peptidase II